VSSIAEADAKCLRYAGFLGHHYVVVVDAASLGDPGGRTSVYETCDRGDAVASAAGEYAERRPVVYRQIKRGKWKRVFGGRK
jgi:hypothetical protein